MESTFHDRDLSHMLEDELDPMIMNTVEWEDENELSMELLRKGVSEHLLPYLENSCAASDMWEMLEIVCSQRFQPQLIIHTTQESKSSSNHEVMIKTDDVADFTSPLSPNSDMSNSAPLPSSNNDGLLVDPKPLMIQTDDVAAFTPLPSSNNDALSVDDSAPLMIQTDDVAAFTLLPSSNSDVLSVDDPAPMGWFGR
jgi:hypothetical protein